MNSGLLSLERAQLHDFLVNHFGQDELELLAFDLGVGYELFNYQNKQKLSLELVAYFERRERLGCLLAEVIRRRPLNNLGLLLQKVSPCTPTIKIQIIAHTSEKITEEIEAFLVALVQKYGLSREAVSLVAAAQGSQHLLLDVPESAAEVLKRSSSPRAEYMAEFTPFLALPERTQKIWCMIAREWPPLAVGNGLLPRISWQKAAELYRLKEKDEMLRRLIAGDRFGAHGTRVALTALSGYAQLLALTAVPGEKQTSYAEKLVQASDDLSESLTVLYSLIGSQEEAVTVKSLLQYLLPSVLPIPEQAGLQLDLRVPDELSASQRQVRCNLVLLTQSVESLVRNAVLISSPNGRIQLSINLEQDELLMQVQDEAATILAEESDAIFEPQGQWPYLQAPDPAHVGRGLGLPLVKMIIQQMDGKIWYEQDAGQGNRFCISLPVSD